VRGLRQRLRAADASPTVPLQVVRGAAPGRSQPAPTQTSRTPLDQDIRGTSRLRQQRVPAGTGPCRRRRRRHAMPRLRTVTHYGKHTSRSHRRPSTRRVELVEQPASTLLDLQPPTRLITGWPGSSQRATLHGSGREADGACRSRKGTAVARTASRQHFTRRFAQQRIDKTRHPNEIGSAP
jgi:hypothetical protein